MWFLWEFDFPWRCLGCQHSSCCCCWNQTRTLLCGIPSQTIPVPRWGGWSSSPPSFGEIHDEILNQQRFSVSASPALQRCHQGWFFSICWSTWSATSHPHLFPQFLSWFSFSAARLWLSLINVWKLRNSPPTSSNSPALSHSLLSFWHLFWVSSLSCGSHNTTQCWGTRIIQVPHGGWNWMSFEVSSNPNHFMKWRKGIPWERGGRFRFQPET